ncbi:bacterio-opsin activator domain-containing protein [Halobacterium yunchengense]|uniref:bacterio-opsin activator domain-containing protein n=1 Tax=Halobacterium yunchengense TaxID=3108497 RepID=UPI00300AD878
MGGDGPALSAADYARLRRATETHREELVVRLAGEVGLRPAELARVRPADVATVDREGATHFFLDVRDEDGDVARAAYLPADVEHDLRQYARTADVADDEPLVSVSPRRVQMLVGEVGDRAADRTGDDALAAVSTRALRRFFARRLLAEEGVDARAVQAVGGWASLGSLDQFAPAPDREAVAAAFADSSLAPERPRDDGAAGPSERFLAALDRVRAVGEAVGDAATRGGVEAAACEALVDGDPYAVAWVARRAGDEFDVTYAAGASTGDVGVAGDGAVAAATANGDVRTTRGVGNGALGAWVAGSDLDAAAVVPVDDGETTYGALGVGVADGAFADRERDLLADLGRRVGRAVTVVQQRKLLLADTVLEVAVETDSDASLFARAAAEHGAAFSLDGVVPGDDALLYFVRVADAAPGDVLSWLADESAVADCRLVRDYGDDALLEVVVTGADLARSLTERGAAVREMTATPARQRVVGDVATNVDVRGLVAALEDAFPGTELASKRERGRREESPAAFRASLHEALTEKQAAVLRAAFHAGYFEWPRGSTAEDLADAIGITSPTLHNHLRRAQQKLLSALFADDDAVGGAPSWPAE